MATAGKVTVDVVADLPESVQRLRALELAVEARIPVTVHDAARTVADAEAYLAFLKGDSST